MRLRAEWLDDPASRAVTDALEGAGHRALYVGGCVRNALLGAPVSDLDIATDAAPEAVVAAAAGAGLRAVPTGIAHGTVTVVSDGRPYEVTTFRRDEETDGRHARVAFTAEVAEDAARRDFTMNALYAAPDGAVVDPLEGLPDLLARRVRFVGAPDARIREDYLRILRFFRFHAWYGDPSGGIDPDALDACARHAGGLGRLSAERIGAEMKKLLAAPDPAPALAAMAASGVLARVMPGASASNVASLVHAEGDLPPRWERRALALGGAVDGWRLSNAEARGMERRAGAAASTLPPAALGRAFGREAAEDAALLAAAAAEGGVPAETFERIAAGAEASFPLAARHLMPALEGPALGEGLKRAERAWLASDLTLDREALRRIALGERA
ncbi:poly(A) polymerase [Hasllibacter halocynthiae]|uniref:Poly(A) polymerase n=1 Tax=Hasllibacter halocynthiae TaxID=595589 RepID=A0A2T0X2B5_9RHOB|nr:CCA tRNA nucleotidyltransferase [Hasllibacter halocynthiae]PRY93047.1 poly(A) polymerase [Hasllibacter halocynthiae]